ncbi:hypothetical protein SAMN02745165_01565 [Malonomonas rubra DSM 5091]|uniref:Uncharacterized protein n=1 Tax=Malonomonas rubra DSM 5091 TaxID=1122189 RepID=A0A1M6GIS8_MALRU|nr:hypothetical protein [Malonomonas rubra]SHJ09836.1 hypothetical protein SAMN02745165_01565 [Malonomonas rubra DSM 5091]
MGCLKGKSEVKQKKAKFECEKCGAMVEKKGHVCKPVNVEKCKKNSHADKCKCSKKKK